MDNTKKDGFNYKKKSWPKCYGLKSVFDFHGHLVVTSVAKEADIAKNETGGFDQENQADCTLIRGVDDMDFSLSDGEKKINAVALENNRKFEMAKPFEYVENPDKSVSLLPREDYLGIAKYICHDIFNQPLDQKFDDTIHNQIAYNIADLEKIIFYQVNDACFAVDNILKPKNFDASTSFRPIDPNLKGTARKTVEFEKDFIGLFQPRSTYQEEIALATSKPDPDKKITQEVIDAAAIQMLTFERFNLLAQPYSPYFNHLFTYPDKKLDPHHRPDDSFYWEHNYNVVRVLSALRHFFTHRAWGESEVVGTEENVAPVAAEKQPSFFDFSNELKKYKGLIDFAAGVYANKARELNESFANTCATDLLILCSYFDTPLSNQEEVQKHLTSYYAFVVGEDQKNIGINLRKVREKMFDLHFGEGSATNLRDTKYDTYRARLYRLLSFVLFIDVRSDSAKYIDANVALLRLARDEEDKDKVYAKMAEDCYQAFKDDFTDIIALVEKNSQVKGEDSLKQFPFALKVENPLGESDDTAIFVQLIFFLSEFLGEKESNDLLTALSNKFDNIVQFMKVLAFLGEPAKINMKYSIFKAENAEKIANQLRVAQKISRLRKNLKKDEVSSSLIGEALNAFSRQNFYAPDSVNENGKLVRDEKLSLLLDSMFKSNSNGDKALRNFLLNNVVGSRRFAYIIRYFDARGIRRLMDAEAAVRFVLSTIPESQISRYYYLLNTQPVPLPQMIDFLVMQLKMVDIDFLLGKRGSLQQWSLAKGRVPVEKQRFLTQVGLYFTVAYLMVKNVVNANARFSSAFSSYERDYSLYAPQTGGQTVNELGKELKVFDVKLTRYFIGQLPKKDEFGAPIFQDGKPVVFGLNKYSWRAQKYLLDYCNYFNRLEKECGAKGKLGRFYRDKVVHLNFIVGLADMAEITSVRSYYDIYVYLVEKWMVAAFKEEAVVPMPLPGAMKPEGETLIQELDQNLSKYHAHAWMFFKYLNAIFGYCYPRFQNLTTSGLFNERDYGHAPKEKVTAPSQFDANE